MTEIRLAALIVLLASSVLANAAGGHGGEHGIPWRMIGWQAFNVTLLFGVLTYFLRKAVVAHFQSRQSTYLDLVNKAEAARAEAQRNREELSAKIKDLEKNTKASLQKAQAEAEELKRRAMAEAEEISKRLKLETERAIHVEVEKAKEQLRLEVLQAALDQARDKLSANLNNSDQKRLQSEFVEKIQAVPQ